MDFEHHGEWDNDLQDEAEGMARLPLLLDHQCDFKKCCKSYKKPGKKKCKKCPKR